MSEKVRASHILAKHNKSRNPKNRIGQPVTISMDEAYNRIAKFRQQLLNNEVDFPNLASQMSDCSSARNGGDLGWFGHGQMVKEFDEVVFNLKIGELSEPFSTASGIHIAWRTG
ncbi:PPIC-type PPIASE domain [Carpediemonas membranifera]|uniref:Peptidyl-prolyl cis-trans isomerase n=1 Tax=Carpediemonas membranifera TaxID=201153 RepID=A0A8J6B8H7_9EUKA|nr:PPIC-type PPIASE domain [Carpediemonas membranifera]|eukprot:KAG9396439.1 PPIC-type PPIASE domain [Carpediemonas membranifera]